MLQHEYLTAIRAAAEVMTKAGDYKESEEKSEAASTFALWPRLMMEFLAQRMPATFEVRAYLLDPAQLKAPKNCRACLQPLAENSDRIDGDPFHGLIRIDEISAQRGFGPTGQSGAWHGKDSDDNIAEPRTGKKLSSQLRNYYAQHLDPFDTPEFKDLQALLALH